MTAKTFYPKTHLFPHQPQILHQMVLQLFLMTDKHADIFPQEDMSHAIIMPYGSYFDTGLVQAACYRYRLGFHKPKRVVLLSFADLPKEIAFLGSDYETIHTFIGELAIQKASYKKLGVTIDNALFAKHADPIICQLPFLRSYQKITEIIPLIINTKKTDLDREKIRSAFRTPHEETCYGICTNIIDPMIKELSVSYEKATGEDLLLFDPEQKISSHSL